MNGTKTPEPLKRPPGSQDVLSLRTPGVDDGASEPAALGLRGLGVKP